MDVENADGEAANKSEWTVYMNQLCLSASQFIDNETDVKLRQICDSIDNGDKYTLLSTILHWFVCVISFIFSTFFSVVSSISYHACPMYPSINNETSFDIFWIFLIN
jgi:hypothetical protein